MASPNEFIYYENDQLNDIYFLKEGTCHIVLPKYQNAPFIRIVEHSCFGLIDFIGSLLAQPDDHVHQCGIMTVVDNEGRYIGHDHVSYHEEEEQLQPDQDLFGKMDLRRRFSAKADDECYPEMLSIDREDLFRMKTEFRREFAEFFQDGVNELEKTITVRLYAMDMCHERFTAWT